MNVSLVFRIGRLRANGITGKWSVARIVCQEHDSYRALPHPKLADQPFHTSLISPFLGLLRLQTIPQGAIQE